MQDIMGKMGLLKWDGEGNSEQKKNAKQFSGQQNISLYDFELINALGAESPEEAISIMQQAGWSHQDIQKFMMQRQMD